MIHCIENIICDSHPNNPNPLHSKEWELIRYENDKEKLKSFDYDYSLMIMGPHQADHCWYAVWKKDDIIYVKVCIGWHEYIVYG